jgi:hypothetical protein
MIEIITNITSALPMLLTCCIGMYFVVTRAASKISKRLALAGLLLLLIRTILNTFFYTIINTSNNITLFRDIGNSIDSGNFMLVFTFYNMLSTFLFVLAIIFLIIAVGMRTSQKVKT